MKRVLNDLSGMAFYDPLNAREIHVIGRQVAYTVVSPIEWWYCVIIDLEELEQEPPAHYYGYVTRRQLEEMEELPQ